MKLESRSNTLEETLSLRLMLHSFSAHVVYRFVRGSQKLVHPARLERATF